MQSGPSFPRLAAGQAFCAWRCARLPRLAAGQAQIVEIEVCVEIKKILRARIDQDEL
jgi:hypothetical protein